MLCAGKTLKMALSLLVAQKAGLPISFIVLSMIEAFTTTVSVLRHPPPSWLAVSIYVVVILGDASGFDIVGLESPAVGLQLYTSPGLEFPPNGTGASLHDNISGPAYAITVRVSTSRA